MNSTTQFTSITPSNITDARPGGTTPHMFTLNWAYPNDNYVVTKVQIYRYITGRTTGETTFDLTNQNYLIATITNNVTNTTSFVDDLTNYYSSNSSTLKNKYNDALTTSDQQLMDEIYYSRRGIIYGIVTSKSGATSTTNISDNAWHHIVGVFDGSTTKIYVDGKCIRHNTSKLITRKHSEWSCCACSCCCSR